MAGKRSNSTEMIRTLVAFDTTSRNSNMALIRHIQAYLEDYGVNSALSFDDDGEKANLLATIGPDSEGGVVLSGHTDVVPVDDQDWHSDPFTVLETDGRLIGRGTADMKGFIAVALALVPEFVVQPLVKPIHFAFSYDEEVGCLGAPRLIDQIVGGGLHPRLAIIGEPTSMTVIDAHKGYAGYVTTVTGLECHSSLIHKGVNAIAVAAELIGELSTISADLARDTDPENGFDPPYGTIQVGTIQGGTAQNIVPRHCRFTWEYRPLPGSDIDEVARRFEDYVERTVRPRIKAVSEAADVETVVASRILGLHTEDGAPAEALIKLLAETNQTYKVSYGTEAGLFQQAGFPAVVCGPGSIHQAHRPDEFIDLDQVAACEAFLRRLIEWARTP
jgi:acetylornithine deacetylase